MTTGLKFDSDVIKVNLAKIQAPFGSTFRFFLDVQLYFVGFQAVSFIPALSLAHEN